MLTMLTSWAKPARGITPIERSLLWALIAVAALYAVGLL